MTRDERYCGMRSAMIWIGSRRQIGGRKCFERAQRNQERGQGRKNITPLVFKKTSVEVCFVSMKEESGIFINQLGRTDHQLPRHMAAAKQPYSRDVVCRAGQLRQGAPARMTRHPAVRRGGALLQRGSCS
jgi:hypothetical protein